MFMVLTFGIPLKDIRKRVCIYVQDAFFIDPNLILYFLRGKKGVINIDWFQFTCDKIQSFLNMNVYLLAIVFCKYNIKAVVKRSL